MSKNLLVYEADKANAEKLTALFEQFGFSVFTAASESKVMDILNETQINAFIVRAENPDMQGFMLCKKIRSLSKYAMRPILLISSNSDETAFARHSNFDYHADYYLRIPADDETLLASLNAVYPFLDALTAEENAQELAALKGKITEENEKIDSLNKEIAEKSDLIRKLTAKNEKLEDNLANAAKIEDETGELKEAIVQKGLRIKNLEEKNSELEEKLKVFGKAAKERDELRKEIDELKKQLDTVKTENGTLASEKAKVEAENKKLSDDAAEKIKKIETLEAKLTEDEKSLKNSFSQSDVDELKKKINDLKDQNDVLSVYNKEMKERVKKAEDNLKKA